MGVLTRRKRHVAAKAVLRWRTHARRRKSNNLFCPISQNTIKGRICVEDDNGSARPTFDLISPVNRSGRRLRVRYDAISLARYFMTIADSYRDCSDPTTKENVNSVVLKRLQRCITNFYDKDNTNLIRFASNNGYTYKGVHTRHMRLALSSKWKETFDDMCFLVQKINTEFPHKYDEEGNLKCAGCLESLRSFLGYMNMIEWCLRYQYAAEDELQRLICTGYFKKIVSNSVAVQIDPNVPVTYKKLQLFCKANRCLQLEVDMSAVNTIFKCEYNLKRKRPPIVCFKKRDQIKILEAELPEEVKFNNFPLKISSI